MLAAWRNRVLALAAAACLMGSARGAGAAWISIKNDTNRVVIVQTAVPVNGQMKRGKPVRLLPGEFCRETVAAPTISLDVYDAQKPAKPAASTTVTIKAERQYFSVTPTPGGSIAIGAK
jgi:hypothetical protein